MRLARVVYVTPSARILLMVLAILLAVCVLPANAAAPEPGTVTIVFQREPQNLDPGCATNQITGHILFKNIVEPLVEQL